MELSSYSDFVEKLKAKLQHAHDLARKHLKTSLEREKQHYDAKSMLHQYQPGDLVWYASEIGQFNIAPKLRKSFIGPVCVTKHYNDLTYMIQLNKKGDRKVVHHDKLLPSKGQNKPNWTKKL
jgi:hypothetical protein